MPKLSKLCIMRLTVTVQANGIAPLLSILNSSHVQSSLEIDASDS